MTRQTFFILFLVLILAAFMRLYNLNGFGYFTGDEEIFHSMVKRVTVEGKPPLVIPNAQIGGSIGSFFILLISPIFALVENDPLILQMVGPIIGLVTTLAIFWVGNLIGRHVAILASILYAGSFMVSLFDRRLWTLSLDPLMIVLSIGALIKIAQRKYNYALLLAVAISFAWHSDPAIAVAVVASVFTFFIFKIPIFKKEFIPAFFYLIFSVLPIIIFELRHPGTIFKPFLVHLVSRSTVEIKIFERLASINIWPTVQNLSRSLFSAPIDTVEKYFCYCDKYPTPFFSPIPELLTLGIFIVSIFWLVKTKNEFERNILKILLIFITSFLIGITIYTTVLAYDVYQHYFVVAFPPFLLLLAFVLNKLRNRLYLVYFFAFVFITINLWTLINSSLRYPIKDKDILVEKTIPFISKSTFSIYARGDYMDIYDGGWVTLFSKYNLVPNRSYLSDGWDFIYRTHSLYTYNPDSIDGEKIIIFHDFSDEFIKNKPNLASKIEKILSLGHISATIIDNKEGWFNSKLLK